MLRAEYTWLIDLMQLDTGILSWLSQISGPQVCPAQSQINDYLPKTTEIPQELEAD